MPQKNSTQISTAANLHIHSLALAASRLDPSWLCIRISADVTSEDADENIYGGRPRWTGIVATRISTGGPHAISLRHHRSCSCRLPGGASIRFIRTEGRPGRVTQQ